MGASSVTSYEIAPDLDYWIPVPRSFPEEEWASAEQWAEDLAEVAIPDDVDLRQVYRMMALDVVNNQVAEAEHTLWYSPEDGHAMGTAHLIILDDDTEQSLAELSLPKYESATPIQVKDYESDVFGKIVQTTSTIAVDLPHEDDGAAILPAIGHVRTAARGHGLVFLLEAYDANLATLGFMMDPMVDLFDTVSFEDDDEYGTEYL
ncbi:hypothetical protein GCM10009715_42810 [Paeniglutamicibacter psychrophenolicus]|uniref:Uncharacterized protein n=1 Tax=Paeniglutamicibacter psychrophenolicus TaxID=257454 RepID=A0ABS4WJ51_9MICC|nr:hypothetical protein [Paeniglutamicibacter psychrophenolicus]MBP2376216.1 hypothetical protein [Paeniglutamicibacter psychrophenolicus]